MDSHATRMVVELVLNAVMFAGATRGAEVKAKTWVKVRQRG